MINRIIEIDSPEGIKLGFTSDKFQGYLYRINKIIYISFIISLNPNKGNLNKLFNEIENHGYQIRVPSPFPNMKSILIRKGFVKSYEYEEKLNETIEVWSKSIHI